MRKIQFGTVSVTRVIEYLKKPEDPWPKQALAKKRERELRHKARDTYDKIRNSKLGVFSRKGYHLSKSNATTLSIVNTDRKRVFGLTLSEDEQPVVISLLPDGLGALSRFTFGRRAAA